MWTLKVSVRFELYWTTSCKNLSNNYFSSSWWLKGEHICNIYDQEFHNISLSPEGQSARACKIIYHKNRIQTLISVFIWNNPRLSDLPNKYLLISCQLYSLRDEFKQEALLANSYMHVIDQGILNAFARAVILRWLAEIVLVASPDPVKNDIR